MYVVLVNAFFEKARADHRIGPLHISLYFALLHELSQQVNLCMPVRRKVIMEKSKICSRVTYHKVVRDLHAYGYIEYRPSYTPGGSVVRLVELC